MPVVVATPNIRQMQERNRRYCAELDRLSELLEEASSAARARAHGRFVWLSHQMKDVERHKKTLDSLSRPSVHTGVDPNDVRKCIRLRRDLMKSQERFTFADLFTREQEQIGGEAIRKLDRGERFDTSDGAYGEPWVRWVRDDRLGLALSGGGIRSATFNLGLLQGMADRGWLSQVHYVTSVSGGGYVGGMWTAWRHRRGSRSFKGAARMDATPFDGPRRDVANPADRRAESHEVRHLREFSRFLIPRLGVFSRELWDAVATILGGLLPTLAIAVVVTAVFWVAWLCVSAVFLTASHSSRLLAIGTTTAGLILIPYLWNRRGGSAPGSRTSATHFVVAVAATAVAVWVWHLRPPGDYKPANAHSYFLLPLVPWISATGFLLALRIIVYRVDSLHHARPAVDQAARAVLAATASWLAIASGWALARWMVAEASTRVSVSGGMLGAIAIAFNSLRGWVSSPRAKAPGKAPFRLLAQLRLGVQMLAALGFGLFCCLVAALVIYFRRRTGDVSYGAPPSPGMAVVALGVLSIAAAVLLMVLNPNRIGLHEYYRRRIARAFLGAGRVVTETGAATTPEENRFTDECPEDDASLGELRDTLGYSAGEPARPVHLICCSANELSGDRMASLSRGARSAVLSCNGLALGDQCALADDLQLSAALAASAAAFNSLMGRVSAGWGWPVAFLMSATGMRLGLWWRHPRAHTLKPTLLPGLLFLYEMVGAARAVSQKAGARPSAPVRGPDAHVHLSDGGHFDNLGLYELVRRHCRYIIVSDATADQKVAFDDLATALRLIREDFGVEIELDVSKLRPDEHGRVRQHAVIGTIHFDGPAGVDKGSLLYFKPGLTGDEPADVLQYQTRNNHFPHESTGDQFYDEAQWESYRRLGEHSARAVIVEEMTAGAPWSARQSAVDHLFMGLRRRWHPAPENHKEMFLELTRRCADLERDLVDGGGLGLRAELFPEVAEALRPPKIEPMSPEDGATPPGKTMDDEIQVIGFLLRILQIMEDVWLAADLDNYWAHPLNEGWMHYFERWAATPSLRRWWPVLQPIYGHGFRLFVRDRFRLRDGTQTGDGRKSVATIDEPLALRAGLAWRHWVRLCGERSLEDRVLWSYRLPIQEGLLVQVGVLVAEKKTVQGGGYCITWGAHELYVIEALHGAGLVSGFLDAVVEHYLKDDTIRSLNVVMSDANENASTGGNEDRTSTEGVPHARRVTPAARLQIVQRLEFYRSRGFRQKAEFSSTLALDLEAVRCTQSG